MAHFWLILGPNSPKYGPMLLKFGPELVLIGSKTLFQNISENSIFFSEIGCTHSLHFFVFVQLWPCLSPWRRPKPKKVNIFLGKTMPSGFQKSQFFRKNMITCPILAIFCWKKGYSQTLKAESKSHLGYTGAMIPGVSNMQGVWSHHMPVLNLSVPTIIFLKFQNTFSSLTAFLGTTPLF